MTIHHPTKKFHPRAFAIQRSNTYTRKFSELLEDTYTAMVQYTIQWTFWRPG